jgi:hypothetical protein
LSSALGAFDHDSSVSTAAGEPSLARVESVSWNQKSQQQSRANVWRTGD